MQKLIAVSFLFGLSTMGAAEAGTGASIADHVFLPAVQEHRTGVQKLHAVAASYCRNDVAREQVVVAWHNAMDNWQRLQVLNIGPVVANGRFNKINYWPDKHGTGARQARRILANKPADLLAADGLKGRSVAVQSLSLVERLLFSTLADQPMVEPANQYACRLMTAIAYRQVQLATEVSDDAGAFAGQMHQADGAGGATYPDDKALLTTILKSVVTAFDVAIDVKLERAMGNSIEKAKSGRLENWRSRRAARNLAQNLRMVHDILTAPNGISERLSAKGAGALVNAVSSHISNLVRDLDILPTPMYSMIEDEDGYDELRALVGRMKTLRTLISGPIADELDVTIGFNATDGD